MTSMVSSFSLLYSTHHFKTQHSAMQWAISQQPQSACISCHIAPDLATAFGPKIQWHDVVSLFQKEGQVFQDTTCPTSKNTWKRKLNLRTLYEAEMYHLFWGRSLYLTRDIVKRNNVVHKRGGEDNFIINRHTAAHQPRVTSLRVHRQVATVTVAIKWNQSKIWEKYLDLFTYLWC